VKPWNWSDLFVDHITGRLRESKVWSNIAKAALTFGFVWAVVHGQNTDWLWMAYGGTVLGHETATRFLNQKEHFPDKESPNAQPPRPV
jgi:hypothetical protein